jgi:very-short-patch-repair endonuclease
MWATLEAAIVRVALTMNAQNVTNTFWALATLGRQALEGSMRPALEGAAVRLAPTMSAKHVANMLWGLATLAWQAGKGPMRPAFEGAFVRMAPNMKVQDVTNSLWAFAALGWHATAELVAVFEQQLEAFSPNGGLLQFSTSHLSQLLQAHLASQFLGLGLITLPPSLLQVALKARREVVQKVTVSESQRQVGESLRRLGVSHKLEYITADGLFSIDLAVVDQRIALEFDGPSHFTRNTLEPLGHTRLRNRLLSAMGWHVVPIPFFDWARLHHPEQMDAYVRHRLLRDPSAPQEV